MAFGLMGNGLPESGFQPVSYTHLATTLAVDFTYQSMLHTLDNGLPLRYGVAFEQALPMLVRALDTTPVL